MTTATATLPKVRNTRVNITADKRAAMVSLLNARLADAADYTLQIKQAHWNVKGMQFVALHEMLDAMAAETFEFADLLAERAVMLGGQARGTVAEAAANTKLPSFPLDATSARDLLSALAASLGVFGGAIRDAIDAADEIEDKDTADLFTEISRSLDKQLWYLEAHLAE